MLAAEKSQTLGILKATIGCGTWEMKITIARCHLSNIIVGFIIKKLQLCKYFEII